MSLVLRNSAHVLKKLWQNDRPLTATGFFMLVALAACSVGLVLDSRLVLGAPVWLKPAKFAASIAVYCFSLAWLFGYLPAAVRTRRAVGPGTALAMLIEMGIISLQAARGTTSHFNVSTPVNAVLFGVMGVAIVAQTLSTIAVAVALFRTRFEDRALGWAARLGMAITIAGAMLGGAMTRPTAAQAAEMRAGRATVSGAHTVGAPDGGPGMPVTGFSREHGDLRVPHFLGLHALQVLPLLALGLRRTRASSRQRERLMVAFSVSYATFVGLVACEALRGHALFAPHASSLAAFVAWVALTTLLTWRALAPSAPGPRVAALNI